MMYFFAVQVLFYTFILTTTSGSNRCSKGSLYESSSGPSGSTSMMFANHCDYYYQLMCNEVSSLTQGSIDCHNYFCYELIVKNTNLKTLDYGSIPLYEECNLFSVALTYSEIETVTQYAFRFFSKIRRLNLEFNKITKLNFVVNLAELRELNLNNNKLIEISATNFNYKAELEIINFAHNNISTIGNSSYDLVALKECYLNNNNIIQINNKLFQNLRVLKILNLGHNKIELITKGLFDGLTNLQELYLEENAIRSIEPETFLPLTNLITLDLSYNNISRIDDNIFIALHKLSWLNLTNNKLFKLSSDSFTGLNSLKYLVISTNYIENLSLGTLKNFPMLEQLQLEHNRLSKFQSGSFSNLANLKLLNLSHNNLVTLDETTFYPLHNLRFLNLDNNKLSVINYTSLLDHLLQLNFININNNHWNCNFLLNILKHFKSRNVDYSYNATRKFSEENIDGISCKEIEENVEEYTTSFDPLVIDTSSSNRFDINEINNNVVDVKDILFKIYNSTNSNAIDIKLLTELEIELNNKLRNNNSSKENNYSVVIEILKDNINKVYKAIQNLRDQSINSSWGCTYPVYFILIFCIVVVFLMAFIIYKKYYYKAKIGRNGNQQSEMAHTYLTRI